MTATPRQLEAIKFFVASGYHPKGGAAIVGNLSQEVGNTLHSGYTLKTDHGSQGVAQWRLDRLTNLEKFAQDNNLNPTDLNCQLLFIIHELEYAPIRGLRWLNAQLKAPGTRTLANLTANFSAFFEIPAKQYENLDNRIAQATKSLAAYEASAPPVVTPSAPVTEVILAGGATVAAASTAVWTWDQGISGPILAGLVVIATMGLCIAVEYIWKHRTAVKAAAAAPVIEPVSVTPIMEMREALDDLKAARNRTEAAEAVLRADMDAAAAMIGELTLLREGK